MKRLILYAAAAAAVIGLVSCGLGVFETTGTLSFTFPEGAFARSPGDGETTYRVELYYGQDRLEREPTPDGDTLIFTDLPTGRVTVVAAQGTVGDDGFFYSEAFGDLEIVIRPGDNGPYTLQLEYTPFEAAAELSGADVVGVVDLGGAVYAATSDSLYSGSFGEAGLEVSGEGAPDVPPGVSVYSLSVAERFEGTEFVPRVWVNGSWSAATGGGIMPWIPGDPDGLDLDFSSGFAAYASGEVQVLRSGSYADEGYGDLVIFFQRDGGIGGVYLANASEAAAPAEWPWIVDEINLTEQLGDLVEVDQEPILDFEIGDSALYLVSSFVTVRVSSDILNSDVVAVPSVDTLFDTTIVAFAPNLGAVIRSVAVGRTDEGTLLYLGTDDGLYAGPAAGPSEASFYPEDDPPELVDGTAGYGITEISVSADGTFVAFVSSRGDGRELVTVGAVGQDATATLRAINGLPGFRVNALDWLDDSVLVVAADHGLAAVDVSEVLGVSAD